MVKNNREKKREQSDDMIQHSPAEQLDNLQRDRYSHEFLNYLQSDNPDLYDSYIALQENRVTSENQLAAIDDALNIYSNKYAQEGLKDTEEGTDLDKPASVEMPEDTQEAVDEKKEIIKGNEIASELMSLITERGPETMNLEGYTIETRYGGENNKEVQMLIEKEGSEDQMLFRFDLQGGDLVTSVDFKGETFGSLDTQEKDEFMQNAQITASKLESFYSMIQSHLEEAKAKKTKDFMDF